eukprot:CAMPEP_0172458160 /NCGR_PEP_ID=MMETSP1065-20121228/26096_1 /TAXON_ID=265537 /ORGANISM="Amphiprora paludosa, Strain CCMP125" /LENGTH=505 /DNA_ID=CAMNT_0013212269 /DNA_START=26 /DNA_END=1543 /DNA_ORIENTATION=+
MPTQPQQKYVASTVGVIAALLLACGNSGVHAFMVPVTGSSVMPASTVMLHSSADNSNDQDASGSAEDDEISKLIGRRSQIKRQKKAEPEPEEVPYENLVDLDLESLPEFKTERPVRRATPPPEEQEEDDDSTKKSDIPIIDFKADYADENDFHIPNRMLISTQSWGDPKRNFVASGKLTKRMLKEGKFVPGDLQLAHEKLLEAGLTCLETSPSYGAASKAKKLSAQDILLRCLKEAPTDVLPETQIITSLGSSAWLKLTPARIAQALYDTVELLDTSTIELFQVPKSRFFPSKIIVNALAQAVESGCCNYAGVQGVTSRSKLAKLCRGMEDQDMSLTTNSFEFSLTNRRYEDMMDTCRDFNVIPLIYNPLDGGLASGVYTATNPSGGRASASAPTQFTFKELEQWQPLHSVQETVAERVATRVKRDMRNLQDRYKSRYGPAPKINTDITTTQVALNYVIAKGGVPVVEVNSPKDAEQVAGSLGWTLTDEEVDMLDNAAALCRNKK